MNQEQSRAVEHGDGPLLVLAGAGSGKTRVLTARVARLIGDDGVAPQHILAVTFTNKAAGMMRERITELLGTQPIGLWVGTFHSICARLLRREGDWLERGSRFSIYAEDEAIRALKTAMEEIGLDPARWTPRALRSRISDAKNAMIGPGEYAATGFDLMSRAVADLYPAYERVLARSAAYDFDDLLVQTVRLLETIPEVGERYADKFKHVLVDEYQDTNHAQYRIIKHLASGHGNICVVGDDDQSIYGWRGAEIDNILRFEKDFPGAKVIRLERNYRSTGHILAAAAGLIAENKGRLGKTLFTDDQPGAKVSVTAVWDDEEEARGIGGDIEEMQQARQSLDEIAILVRASFQMRAFEDRFITLGLPYRVIGGPRFYERQEIKDAIAYLEITANPVNDLKFERIINVPKRGLGDTSVKRVRELARMRSIPMYQAAQLIIETEELTGRARKSLSDLIANFERWRSVISHLKHTELAELILDESGYTAMWQADKSPQAQSRLENLKELVRSMHEFESLQGFLEHVSLVMDTDQAAGGDRVSLMTLHAAKGLEFEVVFLPGWEEGLFPHQRSLDENGQAGLEEERRLAYVGLTRSKRLAKVSFAQNRRNRGLYQSALPSRFVDELPEDHVDILEAKMPFGGAYENFGGTFGNSYRRSRFDDAATPFEASYKTPGWQRAKARTREGFSRDAARKSRGPTTIEGELVASSTQQTSFKPGERVLHQKFGPGTIAGVDGNKLTIEFDEAGRKRVIDSFVERG
jgi:DNA helicase-2/ATP-dependent DNA helicase PcrA